MFALLIHNRNLWPSGQTYRPRLLGAPWQGITGHLVGRFGHAIGFNYRGVEGLFQFRHYLRWQGSRGGAQEAQLDAVDDFPVASGP